jgi:hypothetical protein
VQVTHAAWITVGALVLTSAFVQEAPATGAIRTAARPQAAMVDSHALYSKAAAKAHPRSMPEAGEIHSPGLLDRVARRMNGGLLPETQATEESRRAIDALRAYAATRDAGHYTEALRRVMHLASWNARGTTGYAAAAEDARTVAWTLALGYDWLAPRLDEAQKDRILGALRVRTADLKRDTSHDSSATLTAILTLVAGDLPEAGVRLVQN